MKHFFLLLFMLFGSVCYSQEQEKDFVALSEHLVTNYDVDLTPTQIQDRLTRIVESTVRVSVSGGVGTGTVFNEDNDFYYILTNAHVVGNSRTVGLEFTKNHFASPRYIGEVEKRSLLSGQAFDVAVVKIRKNTLPAHIKLPVMEIAGPDDKPRQLLMVTCGCQAGEMPSVQLTATTKQDDRLIYYLPTSRPGRSGSALVDIEGNKIYGLVAWMTGQGRDAQGLAMTSERIRPWLFNQSLSVSYIDNFPQDAVEIPLASDVYVEQEFEIVKKLSECEEDSCVDGVCPWNNPAMQTQEQIEVDRWLRRFGPQRTQPQQPRPGPSQPTQPLPSQPNNPLNPWSNPQPEQPSEPVKPEYDGQDESNPWNGPGRILPRKPEDKPPVQPKPDPLSDASKIDLIYDSLKKNIEPTLNKIDGKLTTVEESNRESRGLLGRLRDRLEGDSESQVPGGTPSAPRQPFVNPNDLADRVTGGLLERFLNIPLVQTIGSVLRFSVWIIFFIAVDWFMTRLMGPTWIVILAGKVISVFSQLLTIIGNALSSLVSFVAGKFNRPEPKPQTTENLEELMRRLQEVLKSQQPKE